MSGGYESPRGQGRRERVPAVPQVMMREGSISLSYPMLNKSNYSAWCIKMESYMKVQGIWEAVESEEPVETRRNRMALAVIYQGLSDETVLRIGLKKSAKDAWKTLRIMHLGTTKGKEDVVFNQELKKTEKEEKLTVAVSEIQTNFQKARDVKQEQEVTEEKKDGCAEKLRGLDTDDYYICTSPRQYSYEGPYRRTRLGHKQIFKKEECQTDDRSENQHGLTAAIYVRSQYSEIQPFVAISLSARSDDCKKETDEDKSSISAMDQKDDKPKKSTSSRSKAATDPSSSYIHDEDEDVDVSDKEKLGKPDAIKIKLKEKSKKIQFVISETDKQQTKRENIERKALEAAETAKSEALKDDRDAYTVVMGKVTSVLEGEDSADANVKDINIVSVFVSVRGKELLKNASVTISHGRRDFVTVFHKRKKKRKKEAQKQEEEPMRRKRVEARKKRKLEEMMVVGHGEESVEGEADEDAENEEDDGVTKKVRKRKRRRS